MHARPWIAALALSGLFVCVGCVSQDSLKQVEDEVGDLKLEVFKLRSQMEDANKKMAEGQTASAEGRNQDRRFQADLQETLRQLQDTTRVLSNRMGDASVRRSSRAAAPAAAAAPVAPAAAAAAAPVAPAAAAAAVTAAEAPAAGDDDKAFSAAVLDYNRGNYALAAEGLSLFLKTNPQSGQAGDALFYLGLCFYNQKKYDKAKPAFEQILREHANSAQFLPAKLKRAQCLQHMGFKPAAISAFRELTSGFPGSPEARTAQQELADLGF